MPAQFWRVVGGSDKGGILVRHGQDTSSEADASRLSTGAIVKEVELHGERLRFLKLIGDGPEVGWVSLKLKSADLLVKSSAIWEVVGGGAKGGIVVRQGADVNSPEESERLSTGALIKEVETAGTESGPRMNYERLSGSGPLRGWVSFKFRNAELIVEAGGHTLPSEPQEAQLKPQTPPATARKAKILALHGAPANTNIMKFQCKSFQKLAGDEFDWVFLDGPCSWNPVPGATQLNLAERTQVEKMIAKDLPFVQWYSHPTEEARKDGKTTFEGVVYADVEQGIKYLDEYFAQHGSFDVVVAFSQSGTMLALYMDALRKDGRIPPWKLSVLFCGAMIDDVNYKLSEPLPMPTVYVQGGDKDDWGKHGEEQLPLMYTNLTMFGHDDGHAFPSKNPRAAEIYGNIIERMRDACGLA